jgi:hypothetical protein
MIIGLSGLAGSGKDAVADELVAHCGFFKLAVADAMKEACARWFGWTEEQLWGPSHLRNEPDPAWGGLTPRHALQTLGTEWGRGLHPDIWVEQVLRITRGCRGSRFVIPDVRFTNECEAIRNEGGKVVRIVRAGHVGLAGAAGLHSSEAQELTCDATLPNDSTLAVLKLRAQRLPELFL